MKPSWDRNKSLLDNMDRSAPEVSQTRAGSDDRRRSCAVNLRRYIEDVQGRRPGAMASITPGSSTRTSHWRLRPDQIAWIETRFQAAGPQAPVAERREALYAKLIVG